MADPVVHITNGIPDSGTGNITTLGQTLLDGANATLGATTDVTVVAGAAGTINGHLRSISRDIVGGIVLQTGANVIGAMTQSGGPWTISGTVAATQSGTWTVQPGNTANTTPWLFTMSQGGVAAIVTAAGAQKVDGSAVTQPVSLASTTITGTVGVTQSTSPWVVSLASTTITGTVAATQSGTWTVQQGTPPWTVNGDTASGATDANNPVKIGGVARTTNPTAVTNGQRVNATFDKLGKLCTVSALRELKGVQKTSITVATETTVVTAGAAGVFNDVYAFIVTNKSATPVFVDFRDATAGTVRMTLAAPASDTRGFTVTVDSAMVQAVAANNWTATVSSAVSSIEITALYVSNV